MTLTCEECQASIHGRLFGLLKVSAIPCAKCQKCLCKSCACKRSLIPFDEEKEPPPIKSESIHSYCKTCFQEVSLLDYSRTYDIIEAEGSVTDGDKTITFLWVHGGCSSRLMFRYHARILSKKGFRSILMDMPGHGTLADSTTLTLDECTKTVKGILEQENCDHSRTIYIGGSLGAYTGFHVLGQLKDKFAAAVLIDCGQNVGPDCSLKARAGLWVMRKVTANLSNKGLMVTMMNAVKKSKADFHLVETCYAGGMFCEQGVAQCDCLHAVAPASIIPNLEIPILFFNGSEDYRDSENKWLSLCKDKKRSSLKVYEGGDHFFCHDSRFLDDMLNRIGTFSQIVVRGK